MRTIYFLFIGVVLLSLTSCKNDLDEPRIIKGRMMYNCGIPAINAEFFVKNNNPALIGGKYFIEKFKTDSLGFFEVLFYAKTYDNIRIGPGILGYIPLPKAGEKFDLGNVYCNFTYKTVVRLNVTKPYTENDTLYYGDGFISKSIVGPFTSGIIDTVNHTIQGGFDYRFHLNGYSEQASFYIRSNGVFLLNGYENENGVLNVPKLSDACENGVMGEEIYNIR